MALNLRIDILSLVIGSMFWVGIFALVTTAFQGNLELLTLFGALLAVNVLLLIALQLIAPKLFKQIFAPPTLYKKEAANGEISFQLYPLSHPKAYDEELKDYAPELIHVDIARNNSVLFSGHMPRQMLKQLRNAISTVLQAKEVATRGTKPAVKQDSKLNAQIDLSHALDSTSPDTIVKQMEAKDNNSN